MRLTVAAAIAGVAILALAMLLNGWRRGVLCCLDGLARGVLLSAPVTVAHACFGTMGSWCAVPLALAAGWFGRTPLGLLNFLVLQWLGVRLQAEFDRDTWLRGPRGRWWADDAPAGGPIKWSLLRWVWPLTGWWSEYRWIARRR
jgi:hypothetical protein